MRLTVLKMDVKSIRGLARTDFISCGDKFAISYTRRAPASRVVTADAIIHRLIILDRWVAPVMLRIPEAVDVLRFNICIDVKSCVLNVHKKVRE